MIGAPQSIIHVDVEGGIRYNTKVTDGTSLGVRVCLRVRSILESDPILGLPS